MPKTNVGNIEGAEVFLDGKKVDHTFSSLEDSWIIHFTYQSGITEVFIKFAGTSSSFLENNFYLILLLGFAIAGTAILVFYFWKKKK